jgi:large subunit ribosomal protein L3
MTQKKKLGILGTKVGMTQVFTEDGVRLPVTVVKVVDNVITEKRTLEKDGYSALQLGTGDIREKLLTKPALGNFKKKELDPVRHLVEFRASADDLAEYEVGGKIDLSFLDNIESVDVSGVSKGRGFAGVMKRHNMSGFRATHGTHEYFRHGGSIGMRAKPGKVFKGKRMPGHMGDERVTVKNLHVIRVIPELGVVCLRGAVPGAKGALVEIRPSDHRPKRMKGIGGSEAEVRSKNPMKASKAGR